LLSSPVYAALDLGSNSFHLLVATFNGEKLVVVDDIKVMVQLAGKLQADKTLSDESIAQALDALSLFADRLGAIDRKYLRVIGTSTLRQAINADQFLEKAEQILNAPIDIISGVEEARLTYLGVSKDYSPTAKRLIIDIGGGSTECVVEQEEPELLKSLHIGCTQFAKHYFIEGVISAKNYQQALLAARTEVQAIVDEMRQSQWQEAVGSSGTIRCIQQILLHDYQQSVINLDGLERLAADVIKAGHYNKLQFSSLSESRRCILAGGLAVLHGLFIELGINEMHASDQAIREGIIYEMDGRTSYLGRRETTIQQLQLQYHVDTLQAKRVADTANALLQQLDKPLADENAMADLLHWAAQLHEIGLPINHSGYQRHGAYIIENSSMPGFSQQMQQSIAYLIGSHRRKVRQFTPHYRVTQNNSLLIALRLAFLFCRRRGKPVLPQDLFLSLLDGQLILNINPQWLAQYPLVLADLEQEVQHLRLIGIELLLNPSDNSAKMKGQ